ncbi:MAG TPA: cytochrome P450, partial [Chitinophagaceae bacterium]|nr:cytochrome P450 [Chitinophagaceae bacterium]
MAPVKNPNQMEAINRITEQLYPVAEKQVIRSSRFQDAITGLEKTHGLDRQAGIDLFTGNLLGMFIQAFDGIRGLLSNALIQWIRHPKMHLPESRHQEGLEKFLRETLRFDPPVHHTRRIARVEILMDGKKIQKGDSILVVLASANRDPEQFPHPGDFDLERPQNRDHLSFGYGTHHCVADHFAADLTRETLSWMVSRFPRIRLLEKEIQFEPKSNVRLPVHLQIACSTSNPKP